MRFVTRVLRLIPIALLAVVMACSTSNETADPARQSGGRPSTPVVATTPAPRPPCAPDATGEALTVRDLRVNDECFISPLSLRRINANSYELGLNCAVTAAKDATHTATVRRGSEGYSVRLTPDDDALVTDSMDCDGELTISVFVSVVY